MPYLHPEEEEGKPQTNKQTILQGASILRSKIKLKENKKISIERDIQNSLIFENLFPTCKLKKSKASLLRLSNEQS